MNNILFSIVIPTYNRANLIGRCLQSVVSQTYINWEAIVVDNYSEDNTADVVASFNDDRIHFFKNHNYGVISVSRNFALDRARGEWICFLDSDDSWASDKLEQLISYTNSYDIVYHGYKTNSSGMLFFNKTKQLFYTVKEPTVAFVLQRSDPFNPSCSAVSREFIGNTRFSEDIKFFAIEDYDFFLQLLEKKPRIKHLKKYLTFYDVTTGVSHNQTEHLDRSRLIYAKYKSQLTKEEFRNVIRLYMLMRGIKYLYLDFGTAQKYLKIAATSSAIRFKAYKWIIISYVFQILKKFKNT